MDTEHHHTLLPKRPMGVPMKVSVVVSAGLLLILLALNQPLHSSAAPQGMISFQLAATAEQAHAILRGWNDSELTLARMALWLDFLFIVAYLATLLQLTRLCTRDRPGVRERMIARGVRVLFVVAGLSDAAENIALLNNLGPATDSMSLTASLLALTKYTGLMLGAAGLVIVRASRRHPLSPSA